MDGRDTCVIVPVYNCVQYVAEAIESVLNQSIAPGEVLVVDDGSDDDTLSMLERFASSIRLITREHGGIASTRNAAITACTLPVVAFLDADDLMTPQSLELRLERMSRDDAPDGVVGRMEQFMSPELDAESAGRFRFIQGPQRVMVFQTVMVRRSAFDEVGLLDWSFQSGADMDWISRARRAGLRFAEIDDVVAARRIHGNSHSTRIGRQKETELLRVVHSHLQRNRAPRGDA